MQLNLQLTRDLATAMRCADLDESDHYVVTQSLLEALRKKCYFEVEQVVRTHGELSRRVRSRVHLVCDVDSDSLSGHLTVERDGEPVFEWKLPPTDRLNLVSASSEFSEAALDVTNGALTAIMMHAAAIEQRIGDAAESTDIRNSFRHIAANARRAWKVIRAEREVSIDASTALRPN